MDIQLEIRDALNEFSAGLHLESEELPSIFDSGLFDTSMLLEDAVAAEFSTSLAKRALGLRLATRILVDDPSPDAMAVVIHEFGSLVVEMARELRPLPPSSEWHLARIYGEFAEHLTGPSPAENQGFRNLPKMLLESPWLVREFAALAAAADVPLDHTPFAKGFTSAAAKRWIKKATRTPEGQLCAALDHLQHGIEYRARQVWFLRRTDGEERSLSFLYSTAHLDLFPDFHHPLSDHRFALEVAKLKGLALGLQLPEFALCLESADWIAQYGISYLLPPSPADWAVRNAGQLRRLLDARLSRWYFCAFDHKLEPLEMAVGVLKIGRPLFYERVCSHAVLEYSLLQGIAFTRASAPLYVDTLAALEREFQLLIDAYLLRLLHYPRLKAPQGWCDYLAALNSLHFHSGASDELDAYRHVFLARRGLRSTLDILYRTVEGQGALN